MWLGSSNNDVLLCILTSQDGSPCTSCRCQERSFVHPQSATDIDGAHVPMSRYAGRLVVVANVASEDHVRGYTLQVRKWLVTSKPVQLAVGASLSHFWSCCNPAMVAVFW